jgi:hypothetical protein
LRLAVRFRDNEAFTRDYSPLYARLFGVVADWLEGAEHLGDEVAAWLVEAAGSRRSLDVSLLLAARLHRDVLAGEPATAQLRPFYPTAGGQASPDSPDFEAALGQAILAWRDTLADYIRDGRVQTNETGRGLCWVLPLLFTGWPTARLIDLGASAGLNLVAEQRAYRLLDADSRTALLDLGLGEPVQFQTRCHGLAPDFAAVDGRALPRIVGRDGCDLAPFRLEDAQDELTLMSFVWGDQLDRMARLKEGIAALKRANQSGTPVQLTQADLPDDLGRFLHQVLDEGDPDAPVIIYNTWMTSYLKDKGESFGYHIDHWASGQQRPVLWLQWEPPRDGSQPPHPEWCAWTAELWRGQERSRWRLGWVHPHGGEGHLGKGLEEWRRFWGR